LTAFYSFRLINLSFYSNPSGSKKLFELSHEPHLPMTIPLIFLGFCSIFVGYIFRDIFVGPGSPYLQLNSNSDYLSIDSE
jgi:NADH-ubiquinone oxidoreductase chain 5